MRFLADVNIPQSVITSLVESGHDVLDIKKQKLDYKDSELIQIAKKEKRVILTRDKDFLLLTQFPKYQVPTIMIRLRIQTPSYMQERLMQLIKNQDEHILINSLTIIREDTADSHPY
jgi:predicted nuclease of predicted toxin-antitoxin system